MNDYYFYCPKCNYGVYTNMLPNSVPNCRDGLGRPIYHNICPTCGNLDAGMMKIYIGDNIELDYIKSVIKMYQNIRTKD